MRVGYAGFHDRGFVLLLVVVEDCHLVSLYGELHLFAEGDVGGFRPGEVEFFADHVGLGGGLDGEDLVGVGVVSGVGGRVLVVLAVISGLTVAVVGSGASRGNLLLLGIHQFAGLP